MIEFPDKKLKGMIMLTRILFAVFITSTGLIAVIDFSLGETDSLLAYVSLFVLGIVSAFMFENYTRAMHKYTEMAALLDELSDVADRAVSTAKKSNKLNQRLIEEYKKLQEENEELKNKELKNE